MATTKNPFVIQGYQGKAFFCDREEELNLLLDHVLNDRNITLFGWRRLGKTALLQYLAEELSEKHQYETLFVDIAACRDFHDLTMKTVDAVYQKFGKTGKGGIKKNFQKIIGALGLNLSFDAVSGMPTLSIGMNKPHQEKPSLQVLFQFLEELDRRLLIVFDEFQQVEHFKENKAEAVLREFTQTFPSLRFAFSGSHGGIMQSMFNAHSRPFYKSTQLVDIKAIDREEYNAFIIHHFEANQKAISQELAYKIYDWCRGETYSVQMVCNRLFSKYKAPAVEDFLATTQQILSELKRTYTEWTNLLPYNQLQVLKAIARAEPVKNPTSQEFIRAHDLGATSSVQSALKGLMDKEIVFKDEGAYYIHDLLFGKWLNAYFQ